MQVTDIIGMKGSEVVALPPNATVQELVNVLTGRKIGAVVVLGDDKLLGIVSERDIVSFLSRGGELHTPIGDVMSTQIMTCRGDDELEEIATIMTLKRIRHLPVLEDERVVAMVSIGDVVKARLDDLQAERDHLERYVSS